MATSSGRYVGIDVSKDRLDVAMLGAERVWQVDHTQDRNALNSSCGLPLELYCLCAYNNSSSKIYR